MDIGLVITLLVIVGMIIGFMSGRFKLGLVAMTATTVLCLTGVLSFNEAYGYFANTNIVMLGAIFILSGALGKTSLVLKLREWVLRHSGQGQMIILVYMVICAIMTNLSSPPCNPQHAAALYDGPGCRQPGTTLPFTLPGRRDWALLPGSASCGYIFPDD